MIRIPRKQREKPRAILPRLELTVNQRDTRSHGNNELRARDRLFRINQSGTVRSVSDASREKTGDG